MLINYFVWLIDVAPPPDDVKSLLFLMEVWFGSTCLLSLMYLR